MEDVRRIGDFKIVRELSRSSIASVYEGHQPSLDRKVLIKRLHPQLVGDADILARFEREAHALARIKHKNIVHIYDFQAGGESVHLVTEWISGGSLADYLINRGPLTEPETVALAIDLLEGLRVAHGEGIIHRDIKPNNLLISHSGAIKLTDFGLAQFEGSPAVTMQGMVIGTPAYIAPEVVAGKPVDIRCDLYAVGVTLYELITGINPFLADNLSETLSRVMNLKPEPLEGASAEIQKLLFWLLEKKPGKRPQDAGEALDGFKQLAEKHNVSRGWMDIDSSEAASDGDDTDADSVSQTGRRTPSTITPIPRTRSVKKLVYAVIAAVFIALVAVIMIINPFQKTDNAIQDKSTRDSQRVTIEPPVEMIREDPADAGSDDQANSDGIIQETGSESLSVIPTNEEINSTVSQSSMNQDTEQDIAASLPLNLQNNSEAGENAGEPVVPISEEAEEEQLALMQTEGYLMLHVEPWANIYYRSRFIAQTPYNRPLRLPAGEVELTLINPDLNLLSEKRTLYIPPGDTLRESVDLMSVVGVIGHIDATPWARVYLNGESIGETPIDIPIFLPFGQHELRFVNPGFQEHIEMLEITPESEPKSIRVIMSQ